MVAPRPNIVKLRARPAKNQAPVVSLYTEPMFTINFVTP
jgi:hypothetical protein